MQSFLNSPQGPLGSAGQSGTSTMPQNLFNNSTGFGSRFGAGLDAFKNRMGTFSQEARENPLNAAQNIFKPDGLLGGIFGGDGGFLNGMFGQKGLGGIPQNIAQIPQNIAQIPQTFGNMFSQSQQPGGSGGAPSGNPSGGFLSRFMNSGQG
jgi:hypothetical protein